MSRANDAPSRWHVDREFLVEGSRWAVDEANRRLFVRTREEAQRLIETYVPELFRAGVPPECVAVTEVQRWVPARLPTPLSSHTRKERSWEALSDRQRRRVGSSRMLTLMARKVGMTPRQWYERGGSVNVVENRGLRQVGFWLYVDRKTPDSWEVGYRPRLTTSVLTARPR